MPIPDPVPELIFHICPEADWQSSDITGSYKGSSLSLNDGFLHFSSRDQLAESFAKHYPGPKGLVILAVRTAGLAALGADLRWEPSRGGALFPHLYSPVPLAAVERVWPAAQLSELVA